MRTQKDEQSSYFFFFFLFMALCADGRESAPCSYILFIPHTLNVACRSRFHLSPNEFRCGNFSFFSFVRFAFCSAIRVLDAYEYGRKIIKLFVVSSDTHFLKNHYQMMKLMWTKMK